MTRITSDKGALVNDDRLDALAGAVAYWLEHMGRNQKVALRDHHSKKLDAELKRHIEHAIGRKIKSKSPTVRGIKAMRHIR